MAGLKGLPAHFPGLGRTPTIALLRSNFVPRGFPGSHIMTALCECRLARRVARRRVRMILDTIGIQKILPHRHPFLMVDAIIEMERLKRIVGVKHVSIEEYYFQGHFPGKPIMPGVLIIEAMAQTGGLLLLQEIPDREKKLLYFVAVDGARFRRPVLPGDDLRLEVTVLNWRGNFCKLDGKASVNGELAAEATLMCKMVDRDPAPAGDAPAPASATNE